MARHRIFILGGTAEARAIAARLAAEPALRVTTSLAGRTEHPVLPAGEVRTGGFGGIEGLRRWLVEQDVAVLVDATHPFAARISAHASEAAARSGIPLVVFERSRWEPLEGDRWIEAGTVEEAAARLGDTPRRIFLAIGRQELAPFDARRQHRYVVRSVDPIPDGVLPGAVRLLDRGPFDEAAERALFEQHTIEMVVAKNSGGAATYGKIAAARALGVPVVMVRRPTPSPPGAVHTVDEAVEAVHQALARAEARGV